MNRLTTAIALTLVTLALYSPSNAQEPLQPISPPEDFFEITPESFEVDIQDDFIHRITLGDDGRSATILFRNQTAQAYSPRFEILILDRYGLPIKSLSEHWILKTIGAGETKSHNATFFPESTAETLSRTSLTLPSDALQEAAFLVVVYD